MGLRDCPTCGLDLADPGLAKPVRVAQTPPGVAVVTTLAGLAWIVAGICLGLIAMIQLQVAGLFDPLFAAGAWRAAGAVNGIAGVIAVLFGGWLIIRPTSEWLVWSVVWGVANLAFALYQTDGRLFLTAPFVWFTLSCGVGGALALVALVATHFRPDA